MPPPAYTTPTAVAAARAALAALEPPKLSLREAVETMTAEIRAARARGCSDRQILDALSGHGMEMTENTLRSYLAGNRTSTKPPRKGAAVDASAALATTQPEEPAPGGEVASPPAAPMPLQTAPAQPTASGS